VLCRVIAACGVSCRVGAAGPDPLSAPCAAVSAVGVACVCRAQL